MIDTAAISDNQEPFAEEMAERVRVAASWDVVHHPRLAGAFPARIRAANRALKQLERDLASQQAATGSTESGNSSLLELRANWRLLRAALRAISDRPRLVASLPRIVSAAQQDEPRAAAFALIYLRAVNWEFSAPLLHGFIQALQAHEPLTLDELWNLSAFLKFILLESLLDKARALLRSPRSDLDSPIPIFLKSLRSINHADWQYLIEPLIVFDAALRCDPAQTYDAMDFDSRELYRKRVALIARYSDCAESQVAQAALDLALEASEKQSHEDPSNDPRMQQRRIHVGYYLLDKGFAQLAAHTGFHPPLIERMRSFIRADADEFYITGIQLITTSSSRF